MIYNSLTIFKREKWYSCFKITFSFWNGFSFIICCHIQHFKKYSYLDDRHWVSSKQCHNVTKFAKLETLRFQRVILYLKVNFLSTLCLFPFIDLADLLSKCFKVYIKFYFHDCGHVYNCEGNHNFVCVQSNWNFLTSVYKFLKYQKP